MEAEIGVLLPRAGKHRGLLTTRSYKRGRKFLPQSLQREPTLIPDFWPPELQENKFLFIENCQCVVICYGSPESSHPLTRVPKGSLAVLLGVFKPLLLLCPSNSS